MNAGPEPPPSPPGSEARCEPGSRRTVRSFVRRAGRITRAQARALAELWPRFGVAWRPGLLDLDALFGRTARRWLEIGFGNGDALAALAASDPEQDFLGVEVHEPGVGHCLLAIERLGLTNVRLICHDAVDVLREQIPDGSLAGINLFFPDPWPKKRHQKRRIVQPEFVALVARKLAPGGALHVATDWPEYADRIGEVIAAAAAFDQAEWAGQRARTRFEARGERLGHPLWERLYRRRPT